MTAYDPTLPSHRRALAERMLAALAGWGFAEVDSIGERVFAREERPGLELRVYTSIIGRESPLVRAKDADAIRVSLVYVAGEQPRPCGKQRRVHRTGEVEKILARVRERIENASDGLEMCERCGAPKFLAKSKRMVCAALCWKRPASPLPDAPEWLESRVEEAVRKSRANKEAEIVYKRPSPAPAEPRKLEPRQGSARRKPGAPKGEAW